MTFDEMANELNTAGWLVLPPPNTKALINHTIERCAQVAENYHQDICYKSSIAAAIRALKDES
jgi:hypothetical protein